LENESCSEKCEEDTDNHQENRGVWLYVFHNGAKLKGLSHAALGSSKSGLYTAVGFFGDGKCSILGIRAFDGKVDDKCFLFAASFSTAILKLVSI
jgi:hypothetical protein